MTDGPAAYSIYELLRTLVERVGWPTETEKAAALRSITEAERMQILGNLAASMVCSHPEEARNAGKCGDCGRQMENSPDHEGLRYGAPRPGFRYGAGSGRGW